MPEPIRRHYALTPEKVKGGWRVDHLQEHKSRGEAERASLTLLGRYGAGAAVTTMDHELANGEVIDDATLNGRRR